MGLGAKKLLPKNTKNFVKRVHHKKFDCLGCGEVKKFLIVETSKEKPTLFPNKPKTSQNRVFRGATYPPVVGCFRSLAVHITQTIVKHKQGLQ